MIMKDYSKVLDYEIKFNDFDYGTHPYRHCLFCCTITEKLLLDGQNSGRPKNIFSKYQIYLLLVKIPVFKQDRS